MTQEQKISIVRTMTKEPNDEEIVTYLQLAGSRVLHLVYPYDPKSDEKEVPGCYVGNQLAIAAYMLNKRGAEGETSHSENGISRGYENSDIPESMTRDIVPFASVIGGTA